MKGERGRRAMLAVGVAFLLAACTDDSNGDNGDAPGTSPLAEILGWGMATDGAGADAEISEVERQRQLQVEELIADCMAEQGFDYVVVPPEERRAGPFDEAYALAPDEFAERYGYGATTLPAPEEQPPTDPNVDIAENLPDADRETYQQALWGDVAVGGDGDDLGCQASAHEEVYGPDGGGMAAGQDRFDELFDELDLLWERISNDPRLADADQRWAACMADAGYPDFGRPHEAQQAVFDRLAALRSAEEPDPEQVAELRDFELALAPADHACRETHIDGPRRMVAHEMEEQFVAEHRAELEAYHEWISGVSPEGR